MSVQNPTNEYMLLFRGTMLDKGLSPQAMQDVVSRWMAWYERLVRDGRAVTGRPLTTAGKVVSGRGGRNVADGPFAESKEAIGGYFLLNVADFDEAVAIAKQCPGLDHGLQVEVRQVAEQCQVAQRAAQEAARQRSAGELAGASA
jgi:hypothetical protein